MDALIYDENSKINEPKINNVKKDSGKPKQTSSVRMSTSNIVQSIKVVPASNLDSEDDDMGYMRYRC